MSEQIQLPHIPRHVAIIMDGNGRWAQAKKLPRVAGHRAGGDNVRKITTESRKLGIRYLTLYAFSSENWLRPVEEVSALMGLFSRYLVSELKTLTENGVRFRVIGDRDKLSVDLRKKMEEVEKQTESLDGMQMIVAISYGSRNEIVHAARLIAEQAASGKLSPEEISEELFSGYLYAPDVPDPDLLIRTSGECRLSNFLLWQLAYSEIILSPLLWPDFNEEAYHSCLKEYASRERRYGLTAEQVSNSGFR